MKYLLKKNKLIIYDNEIVIVKDYEANNVEACLDEQGFNLFDKLEKEKGVVKGNSLFVGKTRINILRDNDEPNALGQASFTDKISIAVNNLDEALRFTTTEDSPIFDGCYINDNGTLIATDRYRIYYLDRGKSEHSVILHSRFVKELVKLAKAVGGINTIELLYNETRVMAKVGETSLIYGRLVNGIFPDLTKLIETNGLPIAFPKDDILAMIEIGKNVGGDMNIDFKADTEELVIEGDNYYCVDYKAPIDCKFKLNYLVSSISVISNNSDCYAGKANSVLLVDRVDKCKKIVLLPIKR